MVVFAQESSGKLRQWEDAHSVFAVQGQSTATDFLHVWANDYFVIWPFVLVVLPLFALSTMTPFAITQILGNSPKDRDTQKWVSYSCTASFQTEPASPQRNFKPFRHVSCVSFVLLCYLLYIHFIFFFSLMEWLYFLSIKFQRKNYHNPIVRWIFFSR